MHMFNAAEKEAAIAEAVSIPSLLGDAISREELPKATVFLKALTNYIEKTSPLNPSELLAGLNLDAVLSKKDMEVLLRKLLLHMVTVGIEDSLTARMYTTGDVAKIFGVTVATVNNWMKHGRIIGFEKNDRFKQARIPETAIFITVTGERMTLKEASAIYAEEQERTTIRPLTPAQELQELLNDIVFFEKKYGGEYKDTLAQKSEQTPQEERDASEWKYLIQALEALQE